MKQSECFAKKKFMLLKKLDFNEAFFYKKSLDFKIKKSKLCLTLLIFYMIFLDIFYKYYSSKLITNVYMWKGTLCNFFNKVIYDLF